MILSKHNMAKIIPQFYGRVRNGKLMVDKPDDFKLSLTQLEGKDVVIIVKKAEYVRTGAENRYYWGVIVRMVSDEMAVIPEEAHDFLKSLFLKEGVEIKGKRYEIIKSTASLSIGDFEDYCEKVRQFSVNEMGLIIPLPNEISLDDL